jgi:hypothetical protein
VRDRITNPASSFHSSIEAGFYADKTEYISRLFEDEGTYYFFIRPRRFGKSLLLDTIDQIAKGDKAFHPQTLQQASLVQYNLWIKQVLFSAGAVLLACH